MSSNVRPPISCHAVVLYRVSTAKQGHSGLGLEARQANVRSFVTAQGWTLIGEFSDVPSGKDDRCPGFQAALARCRQLGAILVAARLDRITRCRMVYDIRPLPWAWAFYLTDVAWALTAP